MPRQKRQKKFNISEDKKIVINSMIEKFMATDDQRELEFSSSYTTEDRAYIHNAVLKLGLQSKSRGRTNRFLTVYKSDKMTVIHSDDVIKLQDSSIKSIYNCIDNFPLSETECITLVPLKKEKKIDHNFMKHLNESKKSGTRSIPQVPKLKTNPDLIHFRQSLNIMSKREEILKTIESNRVIIITGETGSGKTTQIPQFILEYCEEKNQVCKIVCTQPRRLSAVSVAERVAFERGEKIGQTFGYQIRFENKVSSKTLLTYCTNGILLRNLINEDSPLSMITHVIVDEVHERDQFCDFLLIALKDALVKYQSLKVILMSATIDSSIFVKYFDDCPVIAIPGKLYDVDVYFLEDVLQITNYMTDEMKELRAQLIKEKKKNCDSKSLKKHESQLLKSIEFNKEDLNSEELEKVKLESWLIEEMDKAIEDAWLFGGEDRFTHILYLISSENVPVNYQHSKTFVTGLMAAAGRGYLDFVQNFIKLGADINLKSCNDWTAYHWASKMNQKECAELIKAYITENNCAKEKDKLSKNNKTFISEDNKVLLDIYHKAFDDKNINYDLILKLILHIHLQMPTGSILVFLPGCEDIINMKDKIISEHLLNQRNDYILYILHSQVQTSDQKKVFKRSPPGCRKIILSTNIAETSITIDDVVYVIDSGKVKEKSYDILSGVCTLQSNLISQACAKQRKGRAGRCQNGICYRIYSSVCYNNMPLYQIPQILRLPLEQLCLYTKHLTPPNTSIANFLERAIEPPSHFVIKDSVEFLKAIDALDPWEDLTELGKHLLYLGIKPCLGKMLLYATVLKCLDPILIIVCSLTYKDPFVIPSDPAKKEELLSIRKKFAKNSYSDHIAIFEAYQTWSSIKSYSQRVGFCQKNFLSVPVMEMLSKIKSQFLTQLRMSGFIKPKGVNDINHLNLNSKKWSVIKAVLAAGLYPNFIRLDRQHNKMKTQKENKVLIHSSSVLKKFLKSLNKNSKQSDESNKSCLPSEWMVYEELTRCGRICFAGNVTVVNSVTVAIFSGPTRLPADIICKDQLVSESDSRLDIVEHFEGHSILKLDNWIRFKVNPEIAKLILYLKQKWNALFLRRIKYPHKFESDIEEQFIKTLISVIAMEEELCKVQEPLNIV